MKSALNNKKANSLAKSGWIDDLSEEEEKVLEHSARIDKLMARGKKLKIGILE